MARANSSLSAVSDTIVNVAEQTQNTSDPSNFHDIAGDGKIKFKRAKKLSKKVGSHYKKALNETQQSRFQVRLHIYIYIYTLYMSLCHVF